MVRPQMLKMKHGLKFFRMAVSVINHAVKSISSPLLTIFFIKKFAQKKNSC